MPAFSIEFSILHSSISIPNSFVAPNCLAKMAKMQMDLENKKNSGDESFIKEALREVISLGLQSGRIIQDEIVLNTSSRAAECLSTVLNSVTDAAKELKEYENDKTRIELEREKIDIKKSSSNVPKIQQNNFYGSNKEFLKLLKDSENIKTIEAKIQKEES